MNILITGASGFLGRNLVKRLLIAKVDRIGIYSRGEYAQAKMREEFSNDERLRFFIGDVRDKDRLQRAMSGMDIVIAAAALKRIEAVEYNILEAVQTNVYGTENTVKAAIDSGVKHVVFISTDKAVYPVNGYGFTKALAEKIILSAHHYAGTKGPSFAVCRFGNVSGSTGSIIPTWRKLIAQNKKVPVTDPDCTRFFQTIDQTVDMVIKSLASMRGGELFIPKDLPAYRIGDLAKAMVADVEIIGLKSFEKKHELLQPNVSSENARIMSIDELRGELQNIPFLSELKPS